MIIRVRVLPNAHTEEVIGRVGSMVRVKVTAPAIDGQANNAVRELLADLFDVKPRMVQILRGEKAREKMINICGRSEEDLRLIMESIP